MNKLKEIRLKKRLTQAQIGEIIGVSRYEVSRKEVGETVLNEDQIRKLCKALNVRSDYLLGLTEEKE